MLTFTSQNWNAPQTVTVTGVDDAIADGPVAYTIVPRRAVERPALRGRRPDDVSVTNIDNDTAGHHRHADLAA